MENDELADYLAALQREECYRVDAVLKESPFEITQQVTFIGANGVESGQFIRKYIRREAGMGAAYERLYQAQRAGRRFKHLPRVLECYWREDFLAVVMEYVRGDTLQELVYRDDPSVGLARNVFPTLCDAVAELHEDFDPPIIHRDLKPSNVILSDDTLTIIDFGIAREFKDGAQADTAHFGTRLFAPPEQFGFGQTTERSDVYALGMILYYCLTERIPDISKRSEWYVDQRVPLQLRGVIARATAFDPAQRYASARELKAAFLAAFGEGAAQPHRPAQPAQPAQQAQPAQPAQQAQPAAPFGYAAAAAPFAQAPSPNGGTPTADPAQARPAPETAPSSPSGATSAPPASSPIEPPLGKERKVRPPTSVRNVIIGSFFAIFWLYWLSRIGNPPESNIAYPYWYNALTMGFIIPAIVAIIAFAAWDKTYLKERFPVLHNLRARDYILAFVALMAFFVLCLAFMPAIFGRGA